MNKNVKRIIALALVFGTVSAVAPAANINLLTTKAYASTDNTESKLGSLKLETTSGTSIKLYSDSDYDSSNKVDSSSVPDTGTYYAITSSDTIEISTSGPNSKYVRVFKGTSSSSKGKKTSSNISLSSGTNILTVKVFSSDPGTSVRYDEDTDVESEYTIKVKCTASDNNDSSSSSDLSADDYDNIYLSKLTVDGESITLSESKVTYTYTVNNSITNVVIKALPDDEDSDTVTINGDEVDDSDNYKKTVSLNAGVNKIKIETCNKDNDDDRVYTLNITRSAAAASASTNIATTTPSTATNVVTKTVKVSQWVQQVSGKWQYNDDKGNAIKNSWFYDKNLAGNYYLQEDGSMATGWKAVDGIWYYLGSDGAKRIGWQSVGGNWYYLDGQGRMQIGWIIDLGKYYYLNSNGSMAVNTTIGVYKIGNDGAWIR